VHGARRTFALLSLTVALAAGLLVAPVVLPEVAPKAQAYGSSDCTPFTGWTYDAGSNKCIRVLTSGSSVSIPSAIATAGYTATLIGGGGGGGGSSYNGADTCCNFYGRRGSNGSTTTTSAIAIQRPELGVREVPRK
jgi:hypothetical protein